MKVFTEAEEKGESQPLQQPPNKFDIHRSVYYLYVVSTLLSNADSVQTSFGYRLTKLYYDTLILFAQTLAKQALVSLTDTDSPYEVTIIICSWDSFSAFCI